MGKPILCVDFDGVIHSYTSAWIDEKTISDPPVPGALQWLEKAGEVFAIVIYSSRSKTEAGREAMAAWLLEHSLPTRCVIHADFVHEKPAAFLTIDDRAIQFTGDWAGLEPSELLKFKPWNKRVNGGS